VPPLCGTSAIDSTLTPIVAQSSVDASLTTIETLPVCATWLSGAVLLPPEPPPPQAAISAAATPTGNNRDVLRAMIDLLI
jgi:hypothetical protein